MGKIRQFILDFVEREYKLPENVDYDSFDFVENGFVDSMGMVKFVTMIEAEFDVEFSAEELLSKDFRTVGNLEKLIQKKMDEK